MERERESIALFKKFVLLVQFLVPKSCIFEKYQDCVPPDFVTKIVQHSIVLHII